MPKPVSLLILLLACSPASSPPPSGLDPLETRRAALSAELRELVTELEAAGRYDCCIETPCKLCATRAGGCRCGEGARNGEPVCEECALMWARGKGDEPVEPSTIRSFLEAERLATGAYGDICGVRKPAR